MDQAIAVFMSLTVLYGAACLSPGPNWIMISQLAVSGHRRGAMQFAAGVASGSVAWAVLAIAGAATVLRQWPAAGQVLRACGALYLIWYGGSLLLRTGAVQSASAAVTSGLQPCKAHLRSGLSASLSNPKAAMFWTSIFAAHLPEHPPACLSVAIVAMVASVSTVCHVGIAVLFDSRVLQEAYLRRGPTLQRLAGGLLALAGLTHWYD
jgi:threonine/homoserine/homoserine lactone efflux protein